jgi:hypothetical protein
VLRRWGEEGREEGTNPVMRMRQRRRGPGKEREVAQHVVAASLSRHEVL